MTRRLLPELYSTQSYYHYLLLLLLLLLLNRNLLKITTAERLTSWLILKRVEVDEAVLFLLPQITGVYPVTVITFLDMLTAEEHKKKASDEAGLATGGPGERTYFITNYTHKNNEPSFAVEQTALDILDSALISAESFIRIRKQQERNQMEREAMAGGNV